MHTTTFGGHPSIHSHSHYIWWSSVHSFNTPPHLVVICPFIHTTTSRRPTLTYFGNSSGQSMMRSA